MPEGASLTQLGESVIQAIVNGGLSPDQGAAILQALTAQARLIEIQDLERRITALEANRGQQGTTSSVDTIIRPA